MRLLIQRVKNASVSVGGDELSRIGLGLLVLVGVGVEDTDEDMEYLAGKLVRLRIFDDGQGVMNLDVRQVGGEVLVVSQFTLQASTRKGNRPDGEQFGFSVAGGRIRGHVDGIIAAAPQLLGIGDSLDKYPYQMSGGLQRRCAAARAIVTHPALVLAEATRNCARLPATALVDQFYADVQQMGGGRWDTSSLIKRLK